jgi:hypothetical protein
MISHVNDDRLLSISWFSIYLFRKSLFVQSGSTRLTFPEINKQFRQIVVVYTF